MLGILIGVVLTLFVIALVIILVLRLKYKSSVAASRKRYSLPLFFPLKYLNNRFVNDHIRAILPYGSPAFSEAIWMPKWPNTDMGIDFYQFYTQFPIKIDHISEISAINDHISGKSYCMKSHSVWDQSQIDHIAGKTIYPMTLYPERSVITFLLSFENHAQNVLLPTTKLQCGAIYQPAIPKT